MLLMEVELIFTSLCIIISPFSSSGHRILFLFSHYKQYINNNTDMINKVKINSLCIK